MLNIKVIFDNGGGLTLQLGDYGHYYPHNIQQAAEDYKQYLQDQDTSWWEGNEDDARELDPDYEQIRNGGYRVYSEIEIARMINKRREGIEGQEWLNINEFIKALFVMEEIK